MTKTIHHRSLVVFWVMMCLVISVSAIAQQKNSIDKSVIHLKNASIKAAPNARQWIDSINKLAVFKEPAQVLLHFDQLPTEAQKATLKQQGVTLLDYMPDNTFSAIIAAPLHNDVLPLPVTSIINMQPEWKADSYTWQKINKEKGAVEVMVSFFGGIDAATIQQYVASIGGRINPGPMEQYGSYKMVIASGSVRTLAQWYGVCYISPSTGMVPLDLQSRPAVKGNIAAAPPEYGGYGLLGDSVTVGIGDNTSGIFHVDLKDRIINYNPAAITNHGIHINGIVGGGAIMDPLAASQAPHAQLVDFLFDQIFPATGAMLHDHNMTITNNSYTVIVGDCDYFGTYDLYSRLLDTQALQYPVVQHVFAAGNDGKQNCSPYPPGFATMGGGYQPAKNNIVVGSMTNYQVQAVDESRGPVKDGRLKPDLVAVGASVYSTIRRNEYVWAGGTSMASPQVAGGLAILTQRYKQLHATQPRADLLKTVLLGAAMDLGDPGPDYSYGFGSMDIGRSLQLLDNERYGTGDISNGETRQLTITVPPNTAQLKVTLCWNDIPASPLSATQLINDIDLTVTDPSSVVHLPLVLDAAPANVNNNATEKTDHLNNVEQVTINAPAAGTYTINMKGYSIPYGPQHYVVAYDILPKGVQLTFPTGGEQLCDADTLRVFWNAVNDGNTFTLEFSPDNGDSWIPVSNNIPATQRFFAFVPIGYSSGSCLVRISRNGTGEVATSPKSFAITARTAIALAASQCPGYLNVHWKKVRNATAYLLLKKIGPYMQVVDTVTDTAYSFTGLPLNSASYVAVQPIVNNIPGYRSLAIEAVANSGDCSGITSFGDLMLEQVVAPQSGRVLTRSAIAINTGLTVRVRSLYALPCDNYKLSYRINASSWQTLPGPITIPPKETADVMIPDISFATTGSYDITVAIANIAVTDRVPANDTLRYTIKSIPNDPIDLTTPFSDDFETMGIFSVRHDSIGVSPNGHWDYGNDNDSGRLRSFVYDNISISGNRSVSLDEYLTVTNGSHNAFTGTFNLSNYDTANTEVRVDFDYILHGSPRIADGNMMQARANDNASWRPFCNYNLGSYPGTINKVRSLSLTDVGRLGRQNFSTSTQVSFLQNDTSLIASRNYGNGITLDNFRVYTVANDAMLESIVSPLPGNCGLSSAVPLTIRVRNGVNYTLHNIQLFYRLDAATIFTGVIDSIKAKDTVNYTFAQLLDIGNIAAHKLDVWLRVAGDTYAINDSIMSYKFRNSNIISAYPYLEHFEAGDGGYYADGFNSSWQYGTPASPKVSRAASGTKVWKTNLTGRYNSQERSYLYTPCFDIAQLTNPMLSFSAAIDLENCGSTLCDAAFVEYSFDGIQWTKLGDAGQGTNWYGTEFKVWNDAGFTRWHVASIALPRPGAGQTLHLRFVMAADPAVNFEGLAVDDVHIYDKAYDILPAAGVTNVTRDLSGSQWTNILSAGKLLASVQPNGQNIDDVSATLYQHDTLYNPGATQYVLPRSYTFRSQQQDADNIDFRLYVRDSDIVAVINDAACPSCSNIADAYSLGITQYSNANNKDAENGTLADDTGGTFTFHPYNTVKWVPYDDGYYAELTVKPFSEFWFNDGGPTGNIPAGTDPVNFVAFKSGTGVTAYWYSLIDDAVSSYTLERSPDSAHFAAITNVRATHSAPGEYYYTDPVSFTDTTVLYYRLKWAMTDTGRVYHSPIRRIDIADSATNLIRLDAAMTGSAMAQVKWVSYIDGIVDHYILERSVDDELFTEIKNEPSLRRYGQRYYYTDMPTRHIRDGAQVHYRLTAVMADGSRVVLPVRTLSWVNGSAIVSIYPNPTSNGNFTIVWNADAGTEMHIGIMDAVGKMMDEATITATQWNNVTPVQNKRRPKGVYFLRMEVNGARYSARIVYE